MAVLGLPFPCVNLGTQPSAPDSTVSRREGRCLKGRIDPGTLRGATLSAYECGFGVLVLSLLSYVT